jgi:aldehyde:ferredoxin oxidoreductase
MNLIRILEVDLNRRSWEFLPYPEAAAQNRLWGRGFNVWQLLQELRRPVDPLGADNVLILSCGLLTGTVAATASRLHINALSPLTGLLGSSNIGGYFGERLRACRIQSIIIRGRATQPVFVQIAADSVSIMDADSLWGLDTRIAQDRIRDMLGDPSLKMLVIGPAGENLVPYAGILSGLDHCAGRTGMGAVMGAKQLKAIVAAKPRRDRRQKTSTHLFNANHDYLRRITTAAEFKFFRHYGGAGYIEWANDQGIVATRNYRENRFERIHDIDGRKLKAHVIRPDGCPRCPIQCKARLQMHRHKWPHEEATRPEFESMLNLGPKCGLADLDAIVYFDNLCNRLGIDTISAGTVIAFAMDLFEHGLITTAQTGGLRLTWGNGRIMASLLRQIANREGFGRLLSLGVRNAADHLGENAGHRAAHVKGLELSGYHPTYLTGTALAYAVSSRGGDFNSAYASLEYRWLPDKARRFFGSARAVDRCATEGKGRLVRQAVISSIVLDCLGLCKVPALSLVDDFHLQYAADLTAAYFGKTVTSDDLFKIGQSVADMERMFNLRMQPDAVDDTLPQMFLGDPSGPLSAEGLQRMVQEFYDAMGWNCAGKINDGGLQFFVNHNLKKGA